VLGLIGDVLLFLALLNVAAYLLQPSLVFYPEKELRATPADWGLAYEDVWLSAEDGVRLHGWFLPREGARRTLLFFHGNAGNIADRGDSLAIFHRLGLNVLIFDYRGYGRSEGKPDEAGLYRDAAAAWRYLTESRGFAAKDIVVFGRSLGGAVAAQLASRTAPGGLILESAFSSAKDMAQRMLPGIAYLLYKRYAFTTTDYLRQVRCPVLVLHSPQDEVIPYALGEAVFKAASQPKTFMQLWGDHNSGFLLSQPDYERALAGFIAGLDG
jgi:fermentation-respiration switch protein FrsA (DUF1100 family)